MLTMAIISKHLAKAEAAQDEQGNASVPRGTGRLTIPWAPLQLEIDPFMTRQACLL